MREIKFRAWVEENGEGFMYYGGTHHKDNRGYDVGFTINMNGDLMICSRTGAGSNIRSGPIMGWCASSGMGIK